MDTFIYAAVSIALILAIAVCVLGFDAIFRTIRRHAEMDAFRARVDAVARRARENAASNVAITIHQPATVDEATLAEHASRSIKWALR